MYKFLIIEDHALVREGLGRVLCNIFEEVQVQESASADHALKLLNKENDFSLILLDLALPGMDGFACLEILRKRHPALRVAVLSAYDDPLTINRVMNGGAVGFIPKAYAGNDLVEALHSILNGNTFRPAHTQAPSLGGEAVVMRNRKGLGREECGLTERQGQVLALMVSGKSNRDIALQLGLSEGTVKIHVTGVFKALGVSSRTQAMVVAARYGIRA